METERPSWAPRHIDLDKPNSARVYDYMLGGACNFEVDRQFAEQVLKIMPDVEAASRNNRAFLGRAVRFCVEQGIRQFLDLGSGIPTVGNVHEIAQRIAPECRVLYVDNEPIAVAHSEMILEDNENTAVLQADLCDAETILSSEAAGRLLNFDEPLGLIMVAVLHFIPDEADPQSAIARYLKTMAPGSYFVLSHGYIPEIPDVVEAAESYRRMSTPGFGRSLDGIKEILAGVELVEPGLVWTPQWRPESPEDIPEHPERSMVLAGVGRKQ